MRVHYESQVWVVQETENSGGRVCWDRDQGRGKAVRLKTTVHLDVSRRYAAIRTDEHECVRFELIRCEIVLLSL